MPIYEFTCGKCGAEFEELVFSGETTHCPKCGAADAQKMMSVCARKKKESGFGADADSSYSSSGGCGGCSGGNCSSCGR